jgi:3'-5' exoribonuclease
MECMRALIENDRQVDGCFTTYNSALERTALKKERYLNPQAAAPESRPDGSSNGAVKAPPSTAAPPPPSPAPPPSQVAHPLFAAKPESPFADKLRQALLPAAPKQES